MSIHLHHLGFADGANNNLPCLIDHHYGWPILDAVEPGRPKLQVVDNRVFNPKLGHTGKNRGSILFLLELRAVYGHHIHNWLEPVLEPTNLGRHLSAVHARSRPELEEHNPAPPLSQCRWRPIITVAKLQPFKVGWNVWSGDVVHGL